MMIKANRLRKGQQISLTENPTIVFTVTRVFEDRLSTAGNRLYQVQIVSEAGGHGHFVADLDSKIWIIGEGNER